jgi:hypothetical protein
VRTATPAQWERLVEVDLPTVRDAGFTEIEPGSVTAIAELRRERAQGAGGLSRSGLDHQPTDGFPGAEAG